MLITNGQTIRSETTETGFRASLCSDYESGGWHRFLVTDPNDIQWTSGLIDSDVAKEIAEDDRENFLDQAAQAFDVQTLDHLFED